MHEESAGDAASELHGLQLFINLSERNKLSKPNVFALDGPDVPQWLGGGGDRVRVVVGSFAGTSSPLVPLEPIDLLDIELNYSITLNLPVGHNAVIYPYQGEVQVGKGVPSQLVPTGKAMSVRGGGTRLDLVARKAARLIVLIASALDEPVVMHGPFIMNTDAQIKDAISRFQRGQMGRM